MKHALTIVFCLVALCSQAATNTAATAAYSDVNTALGLCANGDTLAIPAGNVSWGSQLNVGSKLIWIIGSGTNSTIITNGFGSSLITWAPNTKSSIIRISQMEFRSAYGKFYTVDLKGPANMRIDHCRFVGGEDVLSWNFNTPGTGQCIGVVDHCEFINCRTAYRVFDERTTDGGTPGSVAWTEPIVTGTTNVPVFEDDLFHFNSSFSQSSDAAQFYGQYGGKVCVRHCKFGTSTSDAFQQDWIDAHGDDPGYSVILYEVYQNSFFEGTQGSLGANGECNARGGSHIYWSNTFTTISLPAWQIIKYNPTDVHVVTNSFYYGNTWNGDTTQADQVENDSPSDLHLNVQYFFRAIQSGDVWNPYTPLIYPHPLVTSQDGGGGSPLPSSLTFGGGSIATGSGSSISFR